jgi:hypothetical protein
MVPRALNFNIIPRSSFKYCNSVTFAGCHNIVGNHGAFVNTDLCGFRVQDHKTTYLPYSKRTCWWICQIFCVYVHVMSIFGIFLIFSQVDFLIVRAIADFIINGYSTTWFMKNKVFDPFKYETHVEQTAVIPIGKAHIEYDDSCNRNFQGVTEDADSCNRNSNDLLLYPKP